LQHSEGEEARNSSYLQATCEDDTQNTTDHQIDFPRKEVFGDMVGEEAERGSKGDQPQTKTNV